MNLYTITMKKIAVLLSLSILIVSCGNSKKPQLSIEDLIATNNLEQIQTTRKELVTHQHELVGKIKQLDVKINELDTSKRMALITTFEAKTEEFIHYFIIRDAVHGSGEATVKLQFIHESAGAINFQMYIS